ncbi:MAG: ATP-binding cassette domain-containing protein, partial [Candidatus Cloacimonadaceae bacterium]
YVYVLKSDNLITDSEINILYSLLTNLFAQLDISWEAFITQIIESEYEIVEVLDYLDRHLSQLDKIRLIQSLVIMAKSEGDFAISEITEIMELAKKLQLPPDSFLPLIDFFESSCNSEASIPIGHHVSHVRFSIFSDYVIFGTADFADMRFRSNELHPYEMALFAIDKHFFLSVGANSHARLNGEPLASNAINLLCGNCVLELGERRFTMDCLQNIYATRLANDDIVFRKSNYYFIISKEKLSYQIQVYGGSVAQNGRELPHGRRQDVYFDDRLQIKGYAPFDLTMVIEARGSIGVEDYIPNRLYILFEKDYFSLSRIEAENSIATIQYKEDGFYIEPPRKGFKIFLNRELLQESMPLKLNSDTLTINKRSFRINNFYELVESPVEIHKLLAMDIKHYFPDGKLALDSVSFSVEKGQLLAILGQSGCGKSTLMKVLSTEIDPTYGQVYADSKNLHANISFYQEFLGFVPQEDLLYPRLSVYENLYYRLKLRDPLMPESNLRDRVQNILQQVNLSHHRDTIVGIERSKNLSGGERKRLNIALELLFQPTLFICDEPTSGLSFNDAEQIIDILSSLKAQGKIVIITIHQPNSSIFRKFDRVLMMDMGGKIAYYGDPQAAFEYFDDELGQLTVRRSEIERKRQMLTSDYFYDLITYPEYNERGEPVYQQIQKSVQQKRLFPPDYWRDKLKRKMLYEMIQSESSEEKPDSSEMRKPAGNSGNRGHIQALIAFIARSFKMKLRNRTNNLITFIEAPLLGLLIAFILRHTTSSPYSYHDNNNISIYIFVSIIAFIFMGVSNSIEEILSERKIIQRERLMSLKQSYYLISKLFTLSFFSLIQAVLYHIIAAFVLGIPGMGFSSVLYFFLASLTGLSMGLMCSAFIHENRAIINLLPLILIPQIIFGGAVIEFERMNQNLKFYEKHPIPELVQLIPSRWLFEGLATSYAKNTPFHKALAKIEKKELTYLQDYRNAVIGSSEFHKYRSKLYYEKVKAVEKWDPDRTTNSYLFSAVGIMDGRVMNSNRNEFLSSFKLWRKHRSRTWNFNVLIVLLYALIMNMITAVKIKYFLKD